MKSFELHDKIRKAQERKQWDKVKFYAQKWLDQEPNDVYAIQSIGSALEKQGFVDEALQHYEQALSADKQLDSEIHHSFFLRRLDILYHRTCRYEDCLRVCKYYTEQQSHGEYFYGWDAWNRLRRAAQKTGDMELSTTAKERADALKTQREEKKREEETRHQEWLREMGYLEMEEQEEEPWLQEENAVDAGQPTLTTEDDLADLDDPDDIERMTRKIEKIDPFIGALLRAEKAE